MRKIGAFYSVIRSLSHLDLTETSHQCLAFCTVAFLQLLQEQLSSQVFPTSIVGMLFPQCLSEPYTLANHAATGPHRVQLWEQKYKDKQAKLCFSEKLIL